MPTLFNFLTPGATSCSLCHLLKPKPLPRLLFRMLCLGCFAYLLPGFLHMCHPPTVLSLVYIEGQIFLKNALFHPIVTSPLPLPWSYSSWLLVHLWSQVWKRKRKWYLWPSLKPSWASPSTKPFPRLPKSQGTFNFLNPKESFVTWTNHLGTWVVFDCVSGCVDKFTEKLRVPYYCVPSLVLSSKGELIFKTLFLRNRYLNEYILLR